MFCEIFNISTLIQHFRRYLRNSGKMSSNSEQSTVPFWDRCRNARLQPGCAASWAEEASCRSPLRRIATACGFTFRSATSSSVGRPVKQGYIGHGTSEKTFHTVFLVPSSFSALLAAETKLLNQTRSSSSQIVLSDNTGYIQLYCNNLQK